MYIVQQIEEIDITFQNMSSLSIVKIYQPYIVIWIQQYITPIQISMYCKTIIIIIIIFYDRWYISCSERKISLPYDI